MIHRSLAVAVISSCFTSAVVAHELDGTWSGVYSCGPSLGARTPQPISVKSSMTIANGVATWTEPGKRIAHTVYGAIGPNGKVVMSGGGYWLDEPKRAWQSTFEGVFEGTRFVANGVIKTPDGKRKTRDCELRMERTAAAAPVADQPNNQRLTSKAAPLGNTPAKTATDALVLPPDPHPPRSNVTTARATAANNIGGDRTANKKLDTAADEHGDEHGGPSGAAASIAGPAPAGDSSKSEPVAKSSVQSSGLANDRLASAATPTPPSSEGRKEANGAVQPITVSSDQPKAALAINQRTTELGIWAGAAAALSAFVIVIWRWSAREKRVAPTPRLSASSISALDRPAVQSEPSDAATPISRKAATGIEGVTAKPGFFAVNARSAIAGLIAVGAIISVWGLPPWLGGAAKKLPECASNEVTTLVTQMIHDAPALKGTEMNFKIDTPGETRGRADPPRRVCRALLSSALGNETLYYAVEWQQKEKDIIWVEIMGNTDDGR